MKVINLTFLMLYLSLSSVAGQQSMTTSPYSMFGLGDFSGGTYGHNAGMGDVSYGVKDSWFINTYNPAGLTGLDSGRFYAEASAFIKHEYSRSKGSSNNVFNGNFAAFSMGGRIMPRWYMAASVTPYSSVGYYFTMLRPLEGTDGEYVTSIFQGDGGLSDVSLSNALLLPGEISLGVNLSYIFGKIDQKERQGSMQSNKEMSTNTFYANFGLQYERRFSRDVSFILGAVYGYKQKLTLDNTITIMTGSTKSEVNKKKATQYLPQFAGLGVLYTINVGCTPSIIPSGNTAYFIQARVASTLTIVMNSVQAYALTREGNPQEAIGSA